MNKQVLDHGYVRLVDKMGDELSIVNAARVSFDKQSTELSSGDKRLLRFLMRNDHWSPFRSVVFSFEVYAPLFVARQWWKHAVASSHVDEQVQWNESCMPRSAMVWTWDGKISVGELVDGARPPLRSMVDGTIQANRISNVWSVGTADVYRLTDVLGNQFVGTANHRIATPNGWTRLGDLQVGDKVGHNGEPAYANKEWLSTMSRQYTPTELAELCGVSSRTIHKWRKNYSIATLPIPARVTKETLHKYYVEEGRTQKECAGLLGVSVHTIRKYVREYGLQQDQLARLHQYNIEHGQPQKKDKWAVKRGGNPKPLAGSSYNYRKLAIDRGWTHCFYCDKAMEHVHHRDHDRTNNTIANLLPVCRGHHGLLHNQRPFVVGWSKITNIEFIGNEEVFDIEMALEPNFVADGIIVHNSRRYVTEQPIFYTPTWRQQATDKKQGSYEGLTDGQQQWATWHYNKLIDSNLALYTQMITEGVAVEQARIVLPQSVYVRWRWTVSLQALLNFIQLRDHADAQWEIQQYAQVFKQYLVEEFPTVMGEYGYV